MPRIVRYNGTVHRFPDEATDAQIAEALNPGQAIPVAAPAPEPVEALNSAKESVPQTALAQITNAPDFWSGLKAAGGYLGGQVGSAVGKGMSALGIRPGFDPASPEAQVATRQVGTTIGEILTPDPIQVATAGIGGGKVASAIQSIGRDVAFGAGKGLDQAGKVLSRAKAGVSGDLTDLAPTQSSAGLVRRGIETPGSGGGLRQSGDPLIEADKNALGRRLSSGAVVRPYDEGGVTVLTTPSKSTPTPRTKPTPPKNKVIDPFAQGADRDIPELTVTGARKGTTMGSTPLPEGELKSAREIVGEAGSKRVAATSSAPADVAPSIVGPEAAINPAALLDETAARLAQVPGLATRDPRLGQLKEALDLPIIGDSKRAAALRGTIGALLGGAGPAGASEGEDDDTISRRVVYALLGAGLGVAAYPVARRVLAAWRGRPLPQVTLPGANKLGASLASPAKTVGGDLKSAADIAQETYGSIPRPKPNPIIEQALAAAPPPPPPSTVIPILDVGTGQKVAKFTEALFVEGKFKYVPGDVPMTDQMLDILSNGYAGPATINKALAAAGMSHAELIQVLGQSRGSLSEAARWMAQFSVASRNIQKALAKDPKAAVPVSLLGRISWTAHDFMYNTMAMWRGALTSHIATGVRNAWVSLGRGGMQTIDSVIDSAIRKVTGKTSVSPIEGLELYGRMWQYKSTKAAAEEVLKVRPSQWRKLYGDILEAEEAARNSAVGEAVGLLNWHNALQEKFFRNVSMTTALDRELTMRGMDLEAMLKAGQASQIPLDALQKAVDEGLAFTFAKSPDFGTAWWHANKLMHQWWMVPFTPFPRFMYNTYKFYMEYSPLGLVSVLRHGGTRDWAKQVTGAGMLGAAYLFRSSNVAGEKWYQVKVGDKTVDLRPFNPLAGYVFMAEAIRRFNQGEQPMAGREVLEGLVGLNLRAGTGFAFLDSFVDAMSTYGWDDFWEWEKIKQGVAGMTGEWLGGFATPIQQLTDLADQFVDDPYKMERKLNPGTDPFLARMPVRVLPPAVNPLHAEDPKRTATALRFLGFSVEGPRTAAEKEYQKMGMGPGMVLPKSGVVEWDRHHAQFMAQMVDAVVDPFVQGPGYQGLSYAQRQLALRQITSATREIATEFAIRSAPELAAKAKMWEMPKLERKVLTELFGPEVVKDPGSVEVIRFLRSNVPDYAAFLKDVAKSINQK